MGKHTRWRGGISSPLRSREVAAELRVANKLHIEAVEVGRGRGKGRGEGKEEEGGEEEEL